MTREEAIKLLHDMKDTYDEIHENTNCEIGYEQMTALDMAIESLQREEAEEKGWCHRIRPKNVEVVVRCKDCLNYNGNGNKCNWGMKAYDDAYCSHGYYDDGSTPILNCADGERREP